MSYENSEGPDQLAHTHSKTKDFTVLAIYSDNEETEQTARTYRLIWVFGICDNGPFRRISIYSRTSLKHLWDHRNSFEIWVVQATDRKQMTII